jgi:hypothetical protein
VSCGSSLVVDRSTIVIHQGTRGSVCIRPSSGRTSTSSLACIPRRACLRFVQHAIIPAPSRGSTIFTITRSISIRWRRLGSTSQMRSQVRRPLLCLATIAAVPSAVCARKRRTGYAELRPYEAVLHPGDVYVLETVLPARRHSLEPLTWDRGSAGYTSLPTGFTR